MRFPLALLLGLAACATAADWKLAETTLTTPWTADVNPANVLPDYPRPQMVRNRWTNLNGLWDYAITAKDDSRPLQFEGQILVPFPIESALSGVKRPLTPDQRLWYRRTFNVAAVRVTRLLLHFGAVDYRTEVFVNGKSVGTHEGGYDPFTFDISDALNPTGSQELLVSVWDPTDTGLQPRGKQVLNPSSIWYTAVSGIWQTVWLEPVTAVHVESLSMVPDLDGRRLRLNVRTAKPANFTAKASLHGKPAGTISGKTNQEVNLPLSQIEPWSPDSPTLYDLSISLDSGDTVDSYFGMRKVQIRKDAAGFNRIFLNNHPQFMIGPLDQGWWPDGLYTAPTDAALRSDIDTLKKLGYNMERKHVKVEPARWYYWADKLGLLVWQDMPSALQKGRPSAVGSGKPDDIVFSTAEAADFRNELQSIVAALSNAPSIMAWVPFNEGWGQHQTNAILQFVKGLDPSRLVDGPSGWEDRGFGDMIDKHAYPGPDMFPANEARATVLGEFGGLGNPVDDHLWWNKRNWGYRTFESREKMQATYEDLLKQVEDLIAKGLAAAIYTQITDVEGEVNGLMTYDRKVLKYDADKLAALHHHLTTILETPAAAGGR